VALQPDQGLDGSTHSGTFAVTKLRYLFISFAKVGVFGFGGGPSMIPLIQEEVVGARKWLTKEQFLDAFAFGNALPGPIATKLAGHVGYRVSGWLGAIVALLALTVPTILAMIALAAFYLRYQDHPAVVAFLRGVRPMVIALLAVVVWGFAPNALGRPPQWARNWTLWLLAAGAFVLSVSYGVHPALLIVAGGLIGMFFLR
jgi:chromate transporter